MCSVPPRDLFYVLHNTVMEYGVFGFVQLENEQSGFEGWKMHEAKTRLGSISFHKYIFVATGAGIRTGIRTYLL